MKFNVENIPAELMEDAPRVGDVYPAKGGAVTSAWIVMAVRNNNAHLIGVNKEGQITSTTSYGVHTLSSRDRIGFCPELLDMDLTLQIDPSSLRYGQPR